MRHLKAIFCPGIPNYTSIFSTSKTVRQDGTEGPIYQLKRDLTEENGQRKTDEEEKPLQIYSSCRLYSALTLTLCCLFCHILLLLRIKQNKWMFSNVNFPSVASQYAGKSCEVRACCERTANLIMYFVFFNVKSPLFIKCFIQYTLFQSRFAELNRKGAVVVVKFQLQHNFHFS